MTKNEGYKYAMSLRRKNLSHIELEKLMASAGYSEEDVKLVKAWLSSDFGYLNKVR